MHFSAFITSERGQPLYNGQNDPSQCVRYLEVPLYSGTSTLNKGHLCIKDTFRYTNLYSGNTLLPLKEDNLSIMDKMIRPNVSVI